MSSSEPMLCQFSPAVILVRMLVNLALILAMVVGFILRSDHMPFVLLFALLWYLHYFVTRTIASLPYRRFLRRFKAGDFGEAVSVMRATFQFFQRHAWIDRYRWITLSSSSAIGFREMALLNIAFIHTQTGNKDDAKATYGEVLELFPDSKQAKRMLKMIETFES